MDDYSFEYGSFEGDSNYFDTNASIVDDIYRQNLDYEKKDKNKNWIPSDIMLTTQSDMPIIYINSPKERPEIYPVKLATITLNAELPIYFNLKVISLYLPLDEYIVGIKHEHQGKRGWLKVKTKKKKTKAKGRKGLHDFYNQCTINVKPYGDDSDEMINMKFFPNGKIGFTGVKKIGDAEKALRYVLEKIDNLSGSVIYKVKKREMGNAKNFRTKLKQKLTWLEAINTVVSDDPSLVADWQTFIDGIITTGTEPYPNGLSLDGAYGYCLTFLEILFDHFSPTTPIESNEVKKIMEQIMKSYRSSGEPYDQDEIEILSSYITGFDLSLEDMLVKELTIGMDISLLLYQLSRNPQLTISQVMEVFGDKYDFDQLSEIKDILTRRLKKSPLVLTPEDQIEVYQAMRLIKLYHKRESQFENCDEVKIKLSNEEIGEDEDMISIPHVTVERMIKHKIEENNSSELTEKSIPELNGLEDEEEIIHDRFRLTLKAWSKPDGEVPSNSLMDYYNSNCINISNINTTFNTNFILSRSKLYDILIHKYNQTDCSFEPNYGGINLKFISVVDCPLHNDMHDPSIFPEYDGCQCKYVSILIFSNITLITGGRSYFQIKDAYNWISQLMYNEFTNIIKVNKDMPNPSDQYPNIIATDKNKYIKKKFLLENPKNQFLLKKLGLLEQYE